MTTQPGLCQGIVKQVLSGDAIIVRRGPPRGGPPLERTICLSNVTAPRIARRANPNIEGAVETKDEPYAWEAREFLRKKLIGKDVVFKVEYQAGAANRDYGVVWLGREQSGENITELMVSEGLVEVKRGGLFQNNEDQQKLAQLEDAAKASGKGKWAPDAESHVRSITWIIENSRNFVDSQHGKEIPAVIEHVRDGCTVRAFLLPTMNYVTVMLSGIKCPMFKLEGDKQVADEFAEEAKYFSEVRLLQREVNIVLEGVSNANLLGSVIHPNGNIAELLLSEGFARCVDWSMGVVSQGPEKLRAAEKVAKEKKLRIWKDYVPSTLNLDIKDKSYTGKVVECVNGDGLMLKVGDKEYKKIFLASIRPPRQQQTDETDDEKLERAKQMRQRSRPLYDIPYMFEAREFMRKKLIGKKVNVEVDYIQPASGNFPEKTCATVTFSNINIAEALVSKGFASVVRYRQDNEMRSSHYDELLAAEARAQKKGVGMHSKKDGPTHRVADISGDVPKAKQFLPFLKHAGRMEAVVEFVASGSRLRLYIPRETCLITFLLSGISCPRGARPGPGGSGEIPGDDFGKEALLYTKELTLQREVEVEVETMDKGGNFIGYMYVDGVNVSVGLVEDGLAKMHFTAERGSHFKALSAAEERAKTKKQNLWSVEQPEPEVKEVKVDNEPTERKVNHKKVVVTEIVDSGNFFAQNVESGPQLEKLMEQMRTEMTANPPLAGSYTPKRNDMCLAKFTDDEWYRAKLTKVTSSRIEVLYIDYGNSAPVEATRLAVLPALYSSLPAQAKEYALACIQFPPDDDGRLEAVDQMVNDVLNQQVLVNTEYSVGSLDFVTVQYADNKDDVAEGLLSAGLITVESRKEKRLKKLVNTYLDAQNTAKASRLNLWRYGDFQADDAKEFGYQP